MRQIDRAQLEVFVAALRQLDERTLLELRARLVALDEPLPGIPAIDRELERRRQQPAVNRRPHPAPQA